MATHALTVRHKSEPPISRTSLSLQHLLSPTMSCSRPDRVDQRHPTGTDWADVKRNMGTSSTGTDWALRSRILSQQVAGKPQSSSIAFSHAEQTHRPVCVNSTSSKVITKGDAILQPTEVL